MVTSVPWTVIVMVDVQSLIQVFVLQALAPGQFVSCTLATAFVQERHKRGEEAVLVMRKIHSMGKGHQETGMSC
jgi:hypothetical protein